MKRRTMSLRQRASRMAALVCVGALTLTGCDFSVYNLPLPGGADLGDDPYMVTVQFRDVLDLVPQSAVKVDDVTVGRVEEINLDGYTAEVKVLVRESVELPDNAVAQIRQTSLLGEKFVSLEPPAEGASTETLEHGDVIPLERSGRNPEVEEVLGAMSLLLNGGGVAQLKTISTELNDALEGREGNVRSVLDQLDTFMSQLDENKDAIVLAIESLNRLAVSLNEQKGAITLALEEMPEALASINRQRDDLVKMLGALSELSSVGTQVIRDSKAATIDSLEALAPTLTKLAEAGDSLPKALQVFLTYPFVDAVVGKNPAQARNLHMGDYTNLSIQMDLDFTGERDTLPVDPTEECANTPLDPVCQGLPDVNETLTLVQKCLQSQDPGSKPCQKALSDPQTLKKMKEACAKPKNEDNPVCEFINAVPDLPAGGLTTALPTIPGLPGLNRPGFSLGDGAGLQPGVTTGYDEELAPLLVWGMVNR